MDETFWERISAGELGAFQNEHLVSCYTFDTAWPVWEVHPKGDEIVYLLSGSATVLLENERGTRAIEFEGTRYLCGHPKGYLAYRESHESVPHAVHHTWRRDNASSGRRLTS